jgi:hypothetical protein
VFVKKDQPNLATLSVEFWAIEMMMMTTRPAMPRAKMRVAYLNIRSPMRDGTKPPVRAPTDGKGPGPPAGSYAPDGVMGDAIS